jgi:hypothetical protein
VREELDRLERFGWYEYYSHLPFWPVYSNALGATPRKLEQRWRRTTEGGGPRHELYDADNLRAWSLNDASRRLHVPRHFLADNRDEMSTYLQARNLPPAPDDIARLALNRHTKWPRKRMPTIDHVMRDLVVLRRAAHLLGEPVYIFGDGVKEYFNHLENAPKNIWKSVITFLGDASDVEARVRHSVGVELDTIFVSERRMGFGLHPNSKVAQQFSEALNDLLPEDVDPVEDPILERDPRPSAQAWLAARRRLEAQHGGHQRRLYSVHIYCDDNIVIVVGVQRTLRILAAWRRLTAEAGLIMAIPEKRSIGVWGIWLGIIIFSSLGVLATPRQKILRAQQAIAATLRRSACYAEYRSLVGLLEHLRCVGRVPRRFMHALYAPHGDCEVSQTLIR